MTARLAVGGDPPGRPLRHVRGRGADPRLRWGRDGAESAARRPRRPAGEQIICTAVTAAALDHARAGPRALRAAGRPGPLRDDRRSRRHRRPAGEAAPGQPGRQRHRDGQGPARLAARPARGASPSDGVVWEFNYRGSLDFWHQALAQQQRAAAAGPGRLALLRARLDARPSPRCSTWRCRRPPSTSSARSPPNGSPLMPRSTAPSQVQHHCPGGVAGRGSPMNERQSLARCARCSGGFRWRARSDRLPRAPVPGQPAAARGRAGRRVGQPGPRPRRWRARASPRWSTPHRSDWVAGPRRWPGSAPPPGCRWWRRPVPIANRTTAPATGCSRVRGAAWPTGSAPTSSTACRPPTDPTVRSRPSGPTGEPVRAAVVKAGIGYWSISPFEHRVLAAVAVCHGANGCSGDGAPGARQRGVRSARRAGPAGVPASAVALAHVDRNPDPGLHAELAAAGAYLGYDGFARTERWPDAVIWTACGRQRGARRGERILLGGDVARRTRYRGVRRHARAGLSRGAGAAAAGNETSAELVQSGAGHEPGPLAERNSDETTEETIRRTPTAVQPVPPVALSILAEAGRLGGSNGRYEKFLPDLDGALPRRGGVPGACWPTTTASRCTGWRPPDRARSGRADHRDQRARAGHGRGRVRDDPRAPARHRRPVRAVHRAVRSGSDDLGHRRRRHEGGRARTRARRSTCRATGCTAASTSERERFATLFCYAADAGQDYSIIERAGGMKSLVVADGDGWAVEPNPDHSGYQPIAPS